MNIKKALKYWLHHSPLHLHCLLSSFLLQQPLLLLYLAPLLWL